MPKSSKPAVSTRTSAKCGQLPTGRRLRELITSAAPHFDRDLKIGVWARGWTIEEAAIRFGIRARTLESWIAEGRLPSRPKDLARMLDIIEREGGPDTPGMAALTERVRTWAPRAALPCTPPIPVHQIRRRCLPPPPVVPPPPPPAGWSAFTAPTITVPPTTKVIDPTRIHPVRCGIDTLHVIVEVAEDRIQDVIAFLARCPEAARENGIRRTMGRTDGGRIVRVADGVLGALRTYRSRQWKGQREADCRMVVDLVLYVPRDGERAWGVMEAMMAAYGRTARIRRLDIAVDYPVPSTLMLATFRRSKTARMFVNGDEVTWYAGSDRTDAQVAVYDAHRKHGRREPDRFPDPTTRVELRLRNVALGGWRRGGAFLDVLDDVEQKLAEIECIEFEALPLTAYEADLLAIAREYGVPPYRRTLLRDGHLAVVGNLDRIVARVRSASRLVSPLEAVAGRLNQLVYDLEALVIAPRLREDDDEAA